MPLTPLLAPLMPPSHPHPQYRYLVVKSGITAGQHDIWSAYGPADVWSDVPLTPYTPLMPTGRGIWWPRVIQTWVLLTWAHILLSAVFNRPSWVFKGTPPPPVQVSSGQEWYYCRSAWHLVRCLVRCTPPPASPPSAPHPHYKHLVAKSSTTSGQLDIWSAFGSCWPVYMRVNLVPAAMVIPAPWVDINVVAVKKLFCYCL